MEGVTGCFSSSSSPGEADCFQRAGSAASPLPGGEDAGQSDAAFQCLHGSAGRRGLQHAAGRPGERRRQSLLSGGFSS